MTGRGASSDSQRWLMTGATGFLGRAVIQALSQSPSRVQLLVLSRQAAPPADWPQTLETEWVQADLAHLTPDQLAAIVEFAPQGCLHLAWEGIPDYTFTNSLRNLNTALHFCEAILTQTACRRILVSGSCAEYGKTLGVCQESETVVPNAHFAWAKQSLSQWLFWRSQSLAVACYWFRLFYLYGPGQRSGALIPSIAAALRTKRVPELRTPFAANDYLHVADAAALLVSAMTSDAQPGCYNAGSGISTPAAEVCRLIATRLGQKHLLPPLPAETTQQVDFWADPAKTAAAFGWRPRRDLQQGIEDFLQQEGLV